MSHPRVSALDIQARSQLTMVDDNQKSVPLGTINPRVVLEVRLIQLPHAA